MSKKKLSKLLALYLPYIERPDGRTAPFVAGRNGRLTIINVINIEK